jgi:hypothetical protein
VLHGEKPSAVPQFSQTMKTMKNKQGGSNFSRVLRKLFRLGARRHDPLLLLNMSLFNFTDGWSRTFSKTEYARFSA